MARLRRYLVAGLLVWAPVGATIFVFRLLLGLMERLLFWLPAELRPEALFPRLFEFNVPALNAIVSGVLAFVVLAATGMLAANLIGKRLVGLYESWLARIPFVRTVYGSVKHFVEVVFSDTSESFKKVLMIEYPRKGVYALAFQTSEPVGEVQERTGEEVVTVFLPTTPNPTSGFVLFVPREEVVELEMSIEDALKMIVSLGVVVPRWHPEHPEHAALPGAASVPPAAEPSSAVTTPVAEPAASGAEPAAPSVAEPPSPGRARGGSSAQGGRAPDRTADVAHPKAAP